MGQVRRELSLDVKRGHVPRGILELGAAGDAGTRIWEHLKVFSTEFGDYDVHHLYE